MLSILKKSIFKQAQNFSKLKYIANKPFCSKTYLISMTPKKQIGIWLAAMSSMTVGAVVLGGVTRYGA